MLNYNQFKLVGIVLLSLLHSVSFAKFPTWSNLSPEHELHIMQLNRQAQPQKLFEINATDKTTQLSKVTLMVAPYYLHHWVRPANLASESRQKIQLPAENGTTYTYEILHPKNINSFVIGSCTHQTIDMKQMQQVWQAVYQSKPDVIILGGDNVYTDYYLNYKLAQNRDNLARAFIHGLERIPLYSQDLLLPLLSTWDDHDYGMSDGNNTFKLKSDALSIFQAIYSPWIKINPSAIYQSYNTSNLEYDLYLLDGRSQRDPSGGNSHLGVAQLNWLEQSLKKSSKESIIIKGDQFFGGYHRFESYQKDHPAEFERFKNILLQLKHLPVLISGDRHLSEHQLIRFENKTIHEWTSSPMHSKLFPRTEEQKATDNPNRKWVEDAKYNFLKFTLNQQLKVEAFDQQGQLLYSQ
jgi:alkaline phosphatase D